VLVDDDMLGLVLAWLPAPAMRSAQAVCRQWRAVAQPYFSDPRWQAHAVSLPLLFLEEAGLEEAVVRKLESLLRGDEETRYKEISPYRHNDHLLFPDLQLRPNPLLIKAMQLLSHGHRELLQSVLLLARKNRAVRLAEYRYDHQELLAESKHAACLVQIRGHRRHVSAEPDSWKCDESGETLCALRRRHGSDAGLWLNLGTGHIGSGRNCGGGALKHFQETGEQHPLVVKLGTLSPAAADVFSYAADECCLVQDSLLMQHLAFWGIDMLASTALEGQSMVDINFRMAERVSSASICGLPWYSLILSEYERDCCGDAPAPRRWQGERLRRHLRDLMQKQGFR